MEGVLFRNGATWVVWPKDLSQPQLPVLQAMREPMEDEFKVNLVEGELVEYEVVTITTGTSELDIVEIDVARIIATPYIYESPDKGKSIFRRRFGKYGDREQLN